MMLHFLNRRTFDGVERADDDAYDPAGDIRLVTAPIDSIEGDEEYRAVVERALRDDHIVRDHFGSNICSRDNLD